jgi:microcystin-dependent protein
MAGGGNRFVIPNQFTVGADGPRAGAKLYFFQTGTTTPQATYSDVGLTTPNTNPVIADSLGQFGNVFLLGSPAYKVALTDANDVEVWTMDPVGPSLAISGAAAVGASIDLCGPVVPTGWLLCDGSAVSRSTYSELFTAINVIWGAGDGSTTFNLPDFRGRGTIGRDDMGGSAANRVTAGVSGVSGVTLGGVGGNQSMQTHNHTLTDPGHGHMINDEGHQHTMIGAIQDGDGGTTSGNVGNVPGGIPLHDNPATSLDPTGVTAATNTTAITIANAGNGSSQNMPPVAVVNKIIFANA